MDFYEFFNKINGFEIYFTKLEPVEFDDLMLYDTLRDLCDMVNGCIEKFNSERKYDE